MSLSDEEQLDQLKSFWQKYGSAMISGILIALIAFFRMGILAKKNWLNTESNGAKVQN